MFGHLRLLPVVLDPASPSLRTRAKAASVIRDELPAATNVRLDRGPPDPVRYPDQRRRLRPPSPARGLPGERLLNVERGLLQALPTFLPSTDSHLEVRVPRTASSDSKTSTIRCRRTWWGARSRSRCRRSNSSSISMGPRSPVMGAATFLPTSSWPRPKRRLRSGTRKRVFSFQPAISAQFLTGVDRVTVLRLRSHCTGFHGVSSRARDDAQSRG